MRGSPAVLTIVMFLLLFPFSLFAQSSDLDDIEKRWQQMEMGIDRKGSSHEDEIEETWNKVERKQDERWRKYKNDIEKKWERFEASTRKVWVTYEKDRDSKSRLDFENGIIDITAIVPVEDEDAFEKAKEKIVHRMREVFSRKNDAGVLLLEGQLKDRKGEPVTKETLKQFIDQKALTTAKVKGKPYIARDGKKRIKVSAHVEMIPNHIYVRAKKYLDIVVKNSERFGIKPQLILAVIHTESYFNPMAVSSCKALGLMQLIPRYGAREAYRFLYGKDRIIPQEYLYNPENNIELGTAYLHRLKKNHFGEIKETLKNRYLMICGYNWGPTKIKKKIINRYDLSDMSADQLFKLLRKRTPQETRDYLEKVTKRMSIYDPLFL